MGGDAVLGDAVHFLGADLHLEGKGHFPPAHHRGVQGLVHVGLGDRDIVLEAAGHLVPKGMDDAQHQVALGHRVHDHADGDQVIDLVEGLVADHHFVVDGIQVLGPPVDGEMQLGLPQLFGQGFLDLADALLPLRPLHAHLAGDFLVALGVDVAQGKVLQLLLDGVDAQAVGQGGVNIQRFPGDGDLPLGRLEFEGQHVVQAVGQLDQHHADVLAHGQDHLAQGFRLLLLPVGEVEAAQFGHAVHQLGDFRAELLFEGLQRHVRAVLHRVVQEARGDGRRVDHDLGQDAGDVDRMNDIGLPALSLLVGVGLGREVIRMFA